MGNSRDGPQLTSDGKRMRLIWKAGDGDGDSSTYLVEKSMGIRKGHPTWKVFMGDVALPIMRGSANEPPHYVYLDDRACYDIFRSKAYGHDDLKTFWPFDFSNTSTIKQGRKNRGRVAYLDDSRVEVAKGPLRGKGKWYEFSGDLDVEEYRALRPKGTRMEQQVTEELAEQVAEAVVGNDSVQAETPSTSRPAAEPARTPSALLGDDSEDVYPSRPNSHTPTATPAPKASGTDTSKALQFTVQSTDSASPTRPVARVPVSHTFRFGSASSSRRHDNLFRYSARINPVSLPIPPRTVTASLPRGVCAPSNFRSTKAALPIPPSSVTGSPYGSTPASNFRSTPRAMSGDLNKAFGKVPSAPSITPKRTWSASNPSSTKTPNPSVPSNRGFIQPFDVSSSPSDGSPSAKHHKGLPSSAPATPRKGSDFGGDGAVDDERSPSKESPKKSTHLKRTFFQPFDISSSSSEDENVPPNSAHAVPSSRLNVDSVRSHDGDGVQLSYLTTNDFVGAPPRFKPGATQPEDQPKVAKEANAVHEREDEAMCEGMVTALDEPGKYMYKMGMDEEYKALQDEAKKMNVECQSSSQSRFRRDFLDMAT